MTPILNRYLSQWSFYKKALVVFLAVNVFSVCVAVVLGVNFFIVKGDVVREQRAALAQVSHADKALDKLVHFLDDLKSRPPIVVRTRADEQRALAVLANWQSLKTLMLAADPELASGQSLESAGLVFTKEGLQELQNVRTRLQHIRSARLEALQKNLDHHTSHVTLLVLTGVATLIFGILLPHLVLFLMGRALNKVRVEVQNAALDFIARWNDTRASFGDEAFKSAEFWLQVLLLIGEESSRHSRHPALLFTGELAHLVRVELKKKNSEQKAA